MRATQVTSAPCFQVSREPSWMAHTPVGHDNLGYVSTDNMRILVTNDDGIHSPGLGVTEEIARALSGDVWVVAPENEQSGASHSLTSLYLAQ